MANETIIEKMERAAEAAEGQEEQKKQDRASELLEKLGITEREQLLEWLLERNPELILNYQIERLIRDVMLEIRRELGNGYQAIISINTATDAVKIEIRKTADLTVEAKTLDFDWKGWANKLVELGKLPQSAAKNKTQFRRALAARFDIAADDLKDDGQLLAKARELINS